MIYIELLNQLEEQLNKRNTDIKVLRSCIVTLKTDFGKTISTDFLKNLMIGTDRQKENKLYSVIKKLGFELGFKTKFFRAWATESYKTDIVEYYKGTDGKVYENPLGTAEISKAFIKNKVKTFRQFLI